MNDEPKGVDIKEAGVVERERLSPRPAPPQSLSIPPALLLPPVQEASSCRLSKSRWEETSKRIIRGDHCLVFVDKVSDYRDGAMEIRQRIDRWAGNVAKNGQWWQHLILAQSGLVEHVQQQQ